MVEGKGEDCEIICWYRGIKGGMRNILQTFQGIADLLLIIFLIISLP